VGRGENRRRASAITNGARRLLTQVRQTFLAKGNPFDAALAALDLAISYLKEGKAAEVRELTGIGARRNRCLAPYLTAAPTGAAIARRGAVGRREGRLAASGGRSSRSGGRSAGNEGRSSANGGRSTASQGAVPAPRGRFSNGEGRACARGGRLSAGEGRRSAREG
jgi:hypothetical protein